MTRLAQILLLHVFLAAAGTLAAAADKETEQEEAIAAIKKMKGFVEYDAQRPGKPVTKVHLYAGKTAGIGLAPLAKLPEIEWIGLHLSDITEADLEYLKGLTKLRRLGLADIRLTDTGMKRLEGMTTLEILYLMENPITDAGLDHIQMLTKLKELGLGQTKITDTGLEKLKVYKDLQTLGLQQLKITTAGLEHLKGMTKLQKLDLFGCNQVKDLKPLRGLPLVSLNLAYCNQLDTVAPLSEMPLTSLNLFSCSRLRDLTPLADMPLTSLDLGGTQVADLSALRGKKLTMLSCYKTPVSDLTPLAEMPLASLNLLECPKLHDLAPLTGMNLTEISLTPTNFTKDKLEVLRQCKSLKTIVTGTKATDRLAAQDFWKKIDAGEFKP
jgi:Leucine-rich repeat (LRR) protein